MIPIITIKSNVDQATKSLTELQERQVPYAAARTVNDLAKLAQEAEKKAMPSVFDKPTPFTVNSVGVTLAKKAMPVASVFVKDKAAQYLSPFEFGGKQFLGGKPADLVPVNAAPNSYGNLPRGKIQQLLARPDCFQGMVHGVYGVWQRPAPAQAAPVKGRRRADKLANTTGKLRLLVAYRAPALTKKRLNFGARGQQIVAANVDAVFDANLRKALATARL